MSSSSLPLPYTGRHWSVEAYHDARRNARAWAFDENIFWVCESTSSCKGFVVLLSFNPQRICVCVCLCSGCQTCSVGKSLSGCFLFEPCMTFASVSMSNQMKRRISCIFSATSVTDSLRTPLASSFKACDGVLFLLLSNRPFSGPLKFFSKHFQNLKSFLGKWKRVERKRAAQGPVEAAT